MIEWLTLILTAATVVYVGFTYNILKASRETIRVMQDQSIALTRPYVTVCGFPEDETQVFSLRITNAGRTAAQNLQLSMDRPFLQFKKTDISEFPLFRDSIPSFSPGAEFLIRLGTASDLFADNADRKTTPLRFCVMARYSFSGAEVEETTTIDLSPYRNSAVIVDRKLEKLIKAIEKIGKA